MIHDFPIREPDIYTLTKTSKAAYALSPNLMITELPPLTPIQVALKTLSPKRTPLQAEISPLTWLKRIWPPRTSERLRYSTSPTQSTCYRGFHILGVCKGNLIHWKPLNQESAWSSEPQEWSSWRPAQTREKAIWLAFCEFSESITVGLQDQAIVLLDSGRGSWFWHIPESL